MLKIFKEKHRTIVKLVGFSFINKKKTIIPMLFKHVNYALKLNKMLIV